MHQIRLLFAHPTYFALAITTVAFSVGANMLVLTLVGAFWARPTRIARPERVVVVMGDMDGGDNYAMFKRGLERIAADADFEAIAGQMVASGEQAGVIPRVAFPRSPQGVETVAVTPNYFRVLGVPILGRDFVDGDNVADAIPAAIISDRLWRTELDGRLDILGTSVDANPRPLRVIGIAPPRFAGARLGENIDLWVPIRAIQTLTRRLRQTVDLEDPPLMAIARLRANASIDSTAVRLESVPGNRYRGRNLVPLSEVFGASDLRMVAFRPGVAVAAATATATLLLLSGCVTLLALVLVHFERRRLELTVRVALGASRSQLLRQLLRELAMVAGLGALSAVFLAAVGIRLLPRVVLGGAVDLRRIEFRLEWLSLLVGLVAAMLCMVVAAWFPLARVTRPTVTLRAASHLATATRASTRIRQLMVGVHIGATATILILASLSLRTVAIGYSTGAGFDVQRTLFVGADLWRPIESPKAEFDRECLKQRAHADGIVAEIAALPGVELVARGPAPLGPERTHELRFQQRIGIGSDPVPITFSTVRVDGQYMAALGVPFVARSPEMRRIGRAGAILTQSLSRILSPEGPAIGRELTYGREGYSVVGIVNVAVGSIRLGRPPALFLTNVESKAFYPDLSLVVRTREPDRLQDAVRRILLRRLPDSSRVEVTTGRALVAADLGAERLGAWFFSWFGLVELALGVASVFGLVSYVIEGRRQEFGIRMALGATPRQIASLAITAGLAPTVAGCAGGMLAALMATKAIESALVGVMRPDPLAYVLAEAGLLACSSGAALLAGRRAWRVTATESMRVG